MLQKVYVIAAEYLVKYGFQALGGLIILLIGFKIADWTAKAFYQFVHDKKKWDITLSKFFADFVKIIIIVFVAIMALEKFGVTISPLIASISALIFGASFAIQAPLSNYAAGLSVILTRPFVVGNTIQVQGVTGVVDEVKLPCTVLINEDGDKITIPNKDIVGHVLWNSKQHKVVEKTIGISYQDSPEKAIQVILAVLKKFDKVAQEPAPIIGIENFGESSIDIGMRYWVPTKEYFQVFYAVNLAIHKAFEEEKITIPFPQRHVHLINQK